MQRIEVVLSEFEIMVLKNWFEGKRAEVNEIKRGIDIVNDLGEIEIHIISLEKVLNKVEFKISGMVINIQNSMERCFFAKKFNDLIGIFNIIDSGIKDEILLKFKINYNKGGFTNFIIENKISELKSINDFIFSNSSIEYNNNINLINAIKYSDFANEDEIAVCLYLFIKGLKEGYFKRKREYVQNLINSKLDFYGFYEESLISPLIYKEKMIFKKILTIYYKILKDEIKIEGEEGTDIVKKAYNYTYEYILEKFK